jgi:hypothetical protein
VDSGNSVLNRKTKKEKKTERRGKENKDEAHHVQEICERSISVRYGRNDDYGMRRRS